MDGAFQRVYIMRNVLLAATTALAFSLAACEQPKTQATSDEIVWVDPDSTSQGRPDPHSLEAYTAHCKDTLDPEYQNCLNAAIERHLKVEEGIPTRAEVKTAAQTKNLKSFVDWSNAWQDKARGGTPYRGGQGSSSLCKALTDVGQECSYSDRYTLVEYLLGNGVDLFPCEEGSNPYTADMCDKREDNFGNYIGQPGQNKTLEQSVRKNTNLFQNGDLTPANARRWQI